jgi:uncharacterized protein (DUF1800 family)
MSKCSLLLALVPALAACIDDGSESVSDVAALSAGETKPTAAETTVAPEAAVPAVTSPQAVRFLEQATFGPRPVVAGQPVPVESVEHVISVGIPAALTAQLLVPPGTFAPTPPRAAPCDGPFPPALDPGAQFFVAAIEAPDQLRLRVAFALSQIIVVSTNGIPEGPATCNSEKRDAMVRYMNALRTGAFGNYRALLETLTLEPAMGTFLDMANNTAFDRAKKPLTPNENFARELLQLFTVGTYMLNDRGEQILVGGRPVPTYSESTVQGFAKTFTGWTYPSVCPAAVGAKNPARYSAPMIGCDVNHNKTAATLLVYPGAPNGGVTTAGASPQINLKEALDNVFLHPNLPPFVCKQLIQHLVTSNPSPEYVSRVVQVFKNDGTGVRGNLRAVVRTILSDPEARAPGALLAPRYGRLRAPVDLITRVVRSLAGKLDTTAGKDPGSLMNARSSLLGQAVPRPPSVFSYFPPTYAAPQSTLFGPEFGLLNSSAITQRVALMTDMLHTATFAANGISLADGFALIPAGVPAMVEWMNQHLLHGAMSVPLRAAITNALNDARSGDVPTKRRLAVYLTVLSPEFQIQR